MHTLTTGFDFNPHTRIVYGSGGVDRVGALCAEAGWRHALIVTDEHIVAAGHADRVRRSIEAAGLRHTTFDQVRENPTTDDVEACLAVAHAAKIDALIGLGGGSSLDTAKGCNFLLTNGGQMKDYWGTGKATKPMLPMIAIPTTAGTGSECQSYALIADAKSHMKMACGDPKAAARVAILDPSLTLTQPRHVAATTGIDTLTHAVEAAVTTRRNAISWLYAREAFLLCQTNLPRVLTRGDDLDARGQMQLAAAFAGIAIENSMLGAAHSAANPLTAHFNVVHGWAVGLMLPYVVRHNARHPAARALYHALALDARLVHNGASDEQAVDALIRRIHELLDVAQVPQSLAAVNVDPKMIPTLADEAAGQWTAQFNPQPVAAADFIDLYTEAMTGRAAPAARD